jgi:Fe-S-cluster containining protein
MTEPDWYAEGIAFSCQGCGDCCRNHGEYSYVYLTPDNIRLISRHLNMNEHDFLAEYCEEEDSYVSLVSSLAACPFLKKNRCQIYPVRPKQCETWPFWRENLVREIWDGPVSNCCPGIGKGEILSAEDILKMVTERDDWQSKL